MYDVAIIGAGPAGATLARLVAGQYKVLLVDRRDLLAGPAEGPTGKCCGGLLAPDAQRMLAGLGLALPRHVLAEPQLFAVRAIDLSSGLDRFYQRHYINIDRAAFDRWLVSLVPAGVSVRLGWRFEGFSRVSGGVTIHLTGSDRRPHTERARMLVGADGAGSRVRRLIAPRRPRPRRYIAVQEWFSAGAALPYFGAVFDPEVTDFYGWLIPKADRLVVGAALPPGRGAIERFELLKRRLGGLGFRLPRPVRREGGLILRPTRVCQLCAGAEGVALIGEAAGLISPSSGEGMSYAFRSAAVLAEALRAGGDGCLGRHRRGLARLRANILVKIVKSRLITSRSWRRVLMASGLNSMEVSCPPQPAGPVRRRGRQLEAAPAPPGAQVPAHTRRAAERQRKAIRLGRETMATPEIT